MALQKQKTRRWNKKLPWLMGFSSIDFGSLEAIASPNFAGQTIGFIINNLLLYIFPLAGLILLLYIVYGGYNIMLSGGDPKKLADGKGKITSGIAGFIIIFISYWLVQLLARALGFDTVLQIFG